MVARNPDIGKKARPIKRADRLMCVAILEAVTNHVSRIQCLGLVFPEADEEIRKECRHLRERLTELLKPYV